MRYVIMKDATPDMILAIPVLDPAGRVMAEEGHCLSNYAIDKLIRAGYDGIYIQDSISEDIMIEGPISSELRVMAMSYVQKRDVSKCILIAHDIIGELLLKSDPSLDLTEFRSNEDYIYAHSVNVAVLCGLIGLGFGLAGEDLHGLVLAALVHDFGKLDIPTIIRNKAGRLSKEDFQVMKSHAVLSYEYIKNRSDISAHVKKAVRSHHENVDGSGYPDGSLGEEQSLFTKILHVADVYDALISRSPYKKPYSPREASEYLMGGCGVLFDHEVVTTLLKYVPIFPKGTDVVFSDGRVGIIYENSGVNNLRPIVKLYNGLLIDLSQPENFSMTIRLKNEHAISEEYENERKEMLSMDERHKILVVDDMKTNLQMMQDMLGAKYELILAKSGQQAISYIEKKGAPDLILMDIDMPVMDGIDTAYKIKDMMGTKRIPLMFVTSLCDKETVLRCRELKPESYIVRPYNSVYVKTEINRILEGWGN